MTLWSTWVTSAWECLRAKSIHGCTTGAPVGLAYLSIRGLWSFQNTVRNRNFRNRTVPYRTISWIPKKSEFKKKSVHWRLPARLVRVQQCCHLQHTHFTILRRADNANELRSRTNSESFPRNLLNSVPIPKRFQRFLTFRTEPYQTLKGNSATPTQHPTGGQQPLSELQCSIWDHMTILRSHGASRHCELLW